ncbi:MAG: hypothetical protein ACFE9L_00140 [Candidatus Hodarchaeota archaeon]
MKVWDEKMGKRTTPDLPTNQKILKVELQTPIQLLPKIKKPTSEVFGFSQLAPHSYTFKEQFQERQATTAAYQLHGLKSRLRHQTRRLLTPNMRKRLTTQIFGRPNQPGLVAFHVPPLVFIPHNDAKFDTQVQILTSPQDTFFFEADVSRLDLEQLTFLMACALQLSNLNTPRTNTFDSLKVCSMNLINRTTSKEPQAVEGGFTIKTRVEERMLIEELAEACETAERILKGGPI